MKIRRTVYGNWVETAEVPDGTVLTGDVTDDDFFDDVVRWAHEVDDSTDWEEECPAGGAHEWGLLEEQGTGRTWAGCENCGVSRPPERL